MKIKTFAIYCFIALINLYSIISNKIENRNLKNNLNEKFSSGSNNGSELHKNSNARPDLSIDFNTNFMIKITNKGSIINNNDNKKVSKKKEEYSIDNISSEDLNKDKSAASKDNQKNNYSSPLLDTDKGKEKVFIDDFAESGKIVCSSENCRSPNTCSENKDSCLCAFENAEVFSITNLSDNYVNNNSLNSSKNKFNDKGNQKQNYVYCEYRRKSKKIYLVLELFFNLGIGHFYVGNLQKAKLKLIILSLPWVIFAFLLIKRKVNLDDNKQKLIGLPFLFYLLWVFWWLYDLVHIFTGKFKDENGVSVI